MEDKFLEKLGTQRNEEGQEDYGDRYEEGDNGTSIGIDPGKINFKSSVAENKDKLFWKIIEEENNRWIDEKMQSNTDSKDQDKESMEIVEPSDDLIVPLLRFQKEWLAWALKQEESSVRGGILADEMGMGKTLQAIALVLLKRSIIRGIPEHDLTSSSSSSSRKEQLPPVKGTVVICPTVAVKQWEREIYQFTSKGSTKVLVYHGVNRAKNLHQLFDYDFVLTTYSILEREFRKYVLPPKEKCQYCGKLFYEDEMKTHLQYAHACGSHVVNTAEKSRQQSKESCSKKMPDVKVYTGKKNSDEGSKGKSILHSVSWERIILDEAHCIKQRCSNRFKAVLALQSTYKWALTGTPLQNNVGELYSLVCFLQIYPYIYYFCNECDCCMLHYSTTATKCLECHHYLGHHFCWWDQYVAYKITHQRLLGGAERAMTLLKHKILKSFFLRRTKEGRTAELGIPPKIVTLRRDSLDVFEEDYYITLYNQIKAQFVKNKYVNLFALLRGPLLQAIDHPYLVEYSRGSMKSEGKVVDTRSNIKCGLCNDPDEETVVTSCGHVFCKACLLEESSCPSCSKPITVDSTSKKKGKKQRSKTTITGYRSSSILNAIQLSNFQTSTKINALREEIRFMVERDGSAKGIVFSRFSSFLDLIRYALEKSGVHCVQLDGSMSIGEKDAAVMKFNEDPSCRIFLLSLKAGGVALNLTAASHVFMMDPWWNLGTELQAQDRIHRIGQCKPVRVVRFIAENTIEERLLEIQEKKESVFEGTVGENSEAMWRLSTNDLNYLFGKYY